MAKKNNKQTEETVKTTQALRASFPFILGLSAVLVGLSLLVAIVSFLWTGGADRSTFDLSFWELISNSNLTIKNPLGKFGAWIADGLVTNGIGMMGLVVPVIVTALGLRTIGVKEIDMKAIVFHCLAISIWGSVALGLIFFGLSDRYYPLLGGIIGYTVAKWLMSSIGILGTIFLLVIFLVSYMSVFVKGFQDKLRFLIIQLGGKLHIPMPHFDMSEGGVIPASASDASRSDNNAAASPESSTQEASSDEQLDESDAEYSSTDANLKPEDDYDDSSVPPVAPKAASTSSLGELAIEDTRNTVEETDQGIADLVVQKTPVVETSSSNLGSLDTPYDPTAELSHYQYPTFELLNDYKNENCDEDEERRELNEKKDKIIETLGNFNIKIQSIKATIGPTVTLYELVPAPGVKISKIQSLQEDIAMNLQAFSIRVIAPMPGKGTVGIEVPNSKPQVVSMLSMVKSKKFQESKFEIPIVMGKTISNEVFTFDLTKTPHLLVAGATGMGKSVGLNAIVTSILYKMHPSQVKFVMVDPKMVEFSIYRRLEKHFMAKMDSEDSVIITDVDKVKATLNSLTVEMDDRYSLLTKVDVRDIKEYNKKFINRQLNPEHGHRFLPYIVVIIDEFADLIMTAGKEIETPIARIAQKARAVGIHMILATQRPSANIITGVIKANFPARIAFKVSQRIDSQTILDTPGANQLMGKGDMLISMGSSMTRVQCALVDTPEVQRINDFISSQQGYACAYSLPEPVDGDGGVESDGGPLEAGQLDSLFADVARMVVDTQSDQHTFSTSNIQRRFSLGYNRAGKLMDQLERAGIVGPQSGSKPRQVLVHFPDELERILQGFGVGK